MKWFLLVLFVLFGLSLNAVDCSAHHGAAAARANARAARANARAAANFHQAQAQFQFHHVARAAAFAPPVYQYQAPVILQQAPMYAVPQQQFQYAPQRAVSGGCGAALFGY